MSNRSSISKGAIPKQKPSFSIMKGGRGKSKKDTTKKEVVEWQLPAFSIPPQKKTEINWDKLRHDTARRQAPEGEDIKEIRRILKEVKNINVPVHEFINMVGPYTSDNGEALRSVMAEDLESFRQLAKKVYETMTQDVSDVLVNEQLQMVQYYEEKTSQMNDKMMRAINEIYEMAPDFDFEKFLKDKDFYVQTLFPMPKQAEIMLSDEACEMMRRQQAYHRLQWLKSEGERMSEENKRLLHRLEELKKEQQEEQSKATEKAAEAEAKRQELAEEENKMKEKLEKLNESIEKSFIREEKRLTDEHNRTAMQQDSDSTMDSTVDKGARRVMTAGATRKKRAGTASKRCTRPRKLDWSTVTAAEIEEDAMRNVTAAELNKSVSRMDIKKRPKDAPGPSRFSPIKTPALKPASKEVSPFHYSPPATPMEEPTSPRPAPSTAPARMNYLTFGKAKPKRPAKPPSPFHYSPPRTPPKTPPKTPPRDKGPITSTKLGESAFASFGKEKPAPAPRKTSPFHYSPPRSPPPVVQETVIQHSSKTVQQKRPQPPYRENLAPRDTWGGFF